METYSHAYIHKGINAYIHPQAYMQALLQTYMYDYGCMRVIMPHIHRPTRSPICIRAGALYSVLADTCTLHKHVYVHTVHLQQTHIHIIVSYSIYAWLRLSLDECIQADIDTYVHVYMHVTNMYIYVRYTFSTHIYMPYITKILLHTLILYSIYTWLGQ